MSYQDFLNPSQRDYKSNSENELNTLGYAPLDEELAVTQQRELARQIEAEEERKDRKAARQAALRQWTCSCLHRGTQGQRLAFAGFVVGLVIFLVVFFVVPRAPTLSLANGVFFNSTATSGNYSVSPATLYFESDLWLTADTGSTYTPINIHDLEVKVYDLSSGTQVGRSSSSHSMHLSAKSISSIHVPLVFDYTGRNASDAAYGDVTGACIANSTSSLALTFSITSYVSGVRGKQYRELDTNGLRCPVTLDLVS